MYAIGSIYLDIFFTRVSTVGDPLLPTHPELPSTLPTAENPIVAAKKCTLQQHCLTSTHDVFTASGVNSRQKRKAAVVTDEEDGPTTATGMTELKQARPQSATRHIDEHGLFLIRCHLMMMPT
jgi:hypothetical protein